MEKEKKKKSPTLCPKHQETKLHLDFRKQQSGEKFGGFGVGRIRNEHGGHRNLC